MPDWRRAALAGAAVALVGAAAGGMLFASAWKAASRGEALRLSLESAGWIAGKKAGSERESAIRAGLFGAEGEYRVKAEGGEWATLKFRVKADPLGFLRPGTPFEASVALGSKESPTEALRLEGEIADGGSVRATGALGGADWARALLGEAYSGWASGGSVAIGYDAPSGMATIEASGSGIEASLPWLFGAAWEGKLEKASAKINLRNAEEWEARVALREVKAEGFQASRIRASGKSELEKGKYRIESSGSAEKAKIGDRDAGALDWSVSLESLSRSPYERLDLGRIGEVEANRAALRDLAKGGAQLKIGKIGAKTRQGEMQARGSIGVKAAGSGSEQGLRPNLAFSLSLSEEGQERPAPIPTEWMGIPLGRILWSAPLDWAPYQAVGKFEGGALIVNGQARPEESEAISAALREADAALGIAPAP